MDQNIPAGECDPACISCAGGHRGTWTCNCHVTGAEARERIAQLETLRRNDAKTIGELGATNMRLLGAESKLRGEVTALEATVLHHADRYAAEKMLREASDLTRSRLRDMFDLRENTLRQLRDDLAAQGSALADVTAQRDALAAKNAELLHMFDVYAGAEGLRRPVDKHVVIGRRCPCGELFTGAELEQRFSAHVCVAALARRIAAIETTLAAHAAPIQEDSHA